MQDLDDDSFLNPGETLTIDESSVVDALDVVESMALENLIKLFRWRMLLMKIWPLSSDIIPCDLVE